MSTISGVGGGWAAMSAMRPMGQAQMQKKMFERTDSDGDGGVSSSELKTLVEDIQSKTGVTLSSSAEDMLASADADGDGALNADELDTLMKDVMPPPPSTMDFAQSRGATSSNDDLFSKVDADGSGGLDESEFTALMDQMAEDGVTQESDASERFAELDSDGDGTLTSAEFEAGRPEGPPGGPQGMGGMPPPPPPDEAQASTDEDSLQQLMDALDTDGDGQISETEVSTFLDQMESSIQHYNEVAGNSTSSSGSLLDASV